MVEPERRDREVRQALALKIRHARGVLHEYGIARVTVEPTKSLSDMSVIEMASELTSLVRMLKDWRDRGIIDQFRRDVPLGEWQDPRNM